MPSVYTMFHPGYKISQLDLVFKSFLDSSDHSVYILNLLRTYALQNPDVEVRRASLFAWIGQGNLPKIYTSHLIKALKDPDEFVRSMAAFYLSNDLNTSGGSDLEIEQALTDALNDENKYVKLHAHKGLLKKISYQKSYALKLLEKSQKSQIKVSSDDLEIIATLISKDELQDSRIAPLIISQLRSLNVAKDIPVEDWYQSSLRELPGGLARRSTPPTADDNASIKFNAVGILKRLADRNLLTDTDRQALLPIVMSINKQYESYVGRIQIVKLIRQINQSATSDPIAQQRTQWFFYIEAGLLGLVGLTSLSLLLINLRLRNPFPFFWSGYLIFPEEVIAELIALVQRRHAEKVPQWRIRLEIIYEVLLLLWAFQIVIRIDNIKLPPGGNRSAK
ncbi:hypothetical protein [Alkalinema sp. FACHB-956]|uniref:HEAT repeat domain-containing protein n=1 Tax=Alkalinema sp. FACHB-956 TaxID=2692768 RepID=UPI001688E486|nr:hypothetical protein [Alkalinema sp. FACHB-956]MBD2328111.1 hypothetical protein [Alkalinema sp. FACHB-956]